MILERKYHFYAAHRNLAAGEKCARIHGHTYHVICAFNFNVNPDGITMLFADVDKLVEPVIKLMDHRFLLWNEDPLCKILHDAGEVFYVTPFPTSAENMARHIFNLVHTFIPKIIRVELAETESSNIIYEPHNYS